MNMDETLFDLYNHFYTEAMREGRTDIDGSVWAHDQACSTIRELNRFELRMFMKQKGIW